VERRQCRAESKCRGRRRRRFGHPHKQRLRS
jgi:hypothetical protein